MGQAQALFVFRKQQQGLNSLCVLAAAAQTTDRGCRHGHTTL